MVWESWSIYGDMGVELTTALVWVWVWVWMRLWKRWKGVLERLFEGCRSYGVVVGVPLIGATQMDEREWERMGKR